MGIGPKKFIGFSLMLAGLASCGVGLWLLLSPAQYQAMVRIETHPDATDINANAQVMKYDPYFDDPSFDFEVIQSPAVLGKAATSLNLNVVWDKKFGVGGTLTTNESIAILEKHLHLAIGRNTKLIEISFTSSDPNEAARIANAIAKAYQDYCLDMRRQMTLKGIETLQQQYQDEEKKIQIQQTNVDLLREKYKINKDDAAVFGLPPGPGGLKPNEVAEHQKEYERTKAFWDEKRELENLLELHKLLQVKIAVEKSEFQLPVTQLVNIVDAAQSPKSPVGPNRFLGAALLAIGLLSAAGGFLMLKSSRQPL